MKKIILLMILLSSFALAQQMPEEEITTTFQANQLGQIFEYRQEQANGKIQLYQTVRNREIPLGRIEGTINAIPPDRIILKNGAYHFSNSQISFYARGDMIINKVPNGHYPNIIIINGYTIINNLILTCEQQLKCKNLIIKTSEGWLKINGEVSIIEELNTDEEHSEEPYEVIANNLNLKVNKPKEPIRMNLELNVLDNEENSFIGNFNLATESEGAYLLWNKDNKVRETITGRVRVTKIFEPFSEILKHDGRNDVILDYDGEELLKVKKNYIMVVNGDNYERALCRDKYGCFYLEPEMGEANIRLRKIISKNLPTILKLNLDNPIIDKPILWQPFKIKLRQIEEDDPQSKLILEKPSLGNRKIIITRDNVIINGNWEDFGISFSTFLYRREENRYDYLDCRLEEHKCYLNNIQINVQRLAERPEVCQQNGDCGEGVCLGNRCVEGRDCRLFVEHGEIAPDRADLVIEGTDLTRDILFIVEGTNTYEEAENIVERSLYGNDGLFNVEPYKRNKHKFNIWVRPFPPAEIDRVGRPNDESIDATRCPEAEVKIILSRLTFRPGSNIDLRRCKISLLGTEQQNNRILLHELGHCFAGLGDEYYVFGAGKSGHPLSPNCIIPDSGKSAEQIAREVWSNILGRDFGLIENWPWKGCGGDCDQRCANYLKPTENSLMNDHRITNEYNDISEKIIKMKINQIEAIG